MVLADTDRWWHGIGITLLYSVATVAGGIVIGVFCGLTLLGQKRWLTLPLEAYVEIFRCTPLLIQIVWFYYALPAAGAASSITTAAIAAKIDTSDNLVRIERRDHSAHGLRQYDATQQPGIGHAEAPGRPPP